MSRVRSRRWLLGLAAVALLAVVVTGLGFAQATRAPAPGAAVRALQIQTGLFIPGMREGLIMLPPERSTAVTRSKQQANLNLLRNAYFMQDNIPHLRISADRAVKLIPLETMEGAPPTQREVTDSLNVPTAMRTSSLYWNLKAIGKVVKPTTPPDSVDHRSNQTPIRDQDDRGTCVAFASMAGLEVKYGGGTLNLSEQDAYHVYMRQEGRTCCYNYGLQTTNSADYLKSHAVCGETNWGYTNYAGLGCPIANPDAHRPAAASGNARYKIKTFQKIWRNDEMVADAGAYINNPRYLESLLNGGNDIVYGTHVAGWTWPVSGVIDVQLGPGDQPLPSEGGHAMLMVGYNRPGGYFIVKNSWGSGCGQSGYVYLSYDYIRTYAKYGYVITAVEPVLVAKPPIIMRRAPLRRAP